MYHIVPICCPLNNTAMAKNEPSIPEVVKMNGSSSHQNVTEQNSVSIEPTSTQKLFNSNEVKENSRKSTNSSHLKVSEVQTDPDHENIVSKSTNGKLDPSEQKTSVGFDSSNNNADHIVHTAQKTDHNGLNTTTNGSATANINTTETSADSAYASISVGDSAPKMASNDVESNKEDASSNHKEASFTDGSAPSVNNSATNTSNNATEGLLRTHSE